MTATGQQKLAQWVLLLLVGLYAALASGYFVLRYSGRWSGSDTANLTLASATIASAGTLVPPEGPTYGHGFAYQATSVFVTSLTEMSLTQLQFLGFPAIAAGLAIVAFVMYRELTGGVSAGALATLILFLQPDFLFVVFRGSHEKVTHLMAMLAVYLLAKSLRKISQPARLPIYVALFYVSVYATIASNSVFGSSFIVAIAVSLGAGYAVLQTVNTEGATGNVRIAVLRLGYVVLSAMALWFVGAFYLYPPASKILRDLGNLADSAVAVSLGNEMAFDPYATLGWGWVSRPGYLVLIQLSLLTGGVALVVWLWTVVRLLRGKNVLDEDSPRFLLWLLYGGFGFQLAISILLDRLGSIAGNLQLRVFPAVLLMASALLAWFIMRFWRRQADGLKKNLAVTVLILLIVVSSLASLLKATNDPWLSNYWMFWTMPEDAAVQWTEDHLQYRTVWLGLDGARLSARSVVQGFGSDTGNLRDNWVLDANTRDVLLSSLDEDLSVRRSLPLPDVRGENRVYDNGSVTRYHLRPRTPYQR